MNKCIFKGTHNNLRTLCISLFLLINATLTSLKGTYTFDGNLKTFKTWKHHRIAQLERDLVQAKEGQLQKLFRTVYSQILSFSTGRDSTISQSDLLQWLTTLLVKCSLVFRWNFRRPINDLNKEQFDLLIFIPSNIYTHCLRSPRAFFCQGEQAQCSQPLLIHKFLQLHLCRPVLDSLHIFFLLKSLGLDTALQMCSHERWT